MKFIDYLLTLSGRECTIYIREMSAPPRAEDGARWGLQGYIQVEEDFLLVHMDGDFENGIAVRFEDILTIEPMTTDEEEEEIEEAEDDIHIKFEKWYQERKDK